MVFPNSSPNWLKILPETPQGEHSPADTMILDSDLHNSDRMSFCCCEPPVGRSLLWQLQETNTDII